MPPTPATHHRLTAAEVEMAFSYCDLQGDGLVTAAGLRARLAPLLLGFTDKKEQAALVETLLGGKPALTLAELTAVLLAPPDGANAKPAAAAKTKIKDLVAEAFALLAGPEEGLFITRGALAQWLLRVDFLQASERDLDLLVQAADADGDGKIGVDDFCALLTSTVVVVEEEEGEEEGGEIDGEEEGEEGV